MKTIRITLLKEEIDKFIDNATWKRVDATMDKESQRTQNALASDSSESNDGFLISKYRDRWDARIRQRLKFCLVERTAEFMEYTNIPKWEPAYIYDLKVDDKFTIDDLKSLGSRLNEYIERGCVLDWYKDAGIATTDTYDSIKILEDDIVSALRGQAWGRRPMQPFGPAMFNYKEDY